MLSRIQALYLNLGISGLYEVSDASKSWTEICNVLTELQNAGLQ